MLIALVALALLSRSESVLVVKNVQVLAMTDERVQASRTVVIRDGRVDRVMDASTTDWPAGATVVDGHGQYLIPGLVDMHVHLPLHDADLLLWLYLANGVTTVQSMHGGVHQLALRERVNGGQIPGPRIFTTGPTTAQQHVHSMAQAEALVREQKGAGFDAIKMYGDGRDTMPRETYARLIERAHEANLRVVGHAPRNLPFTVVIEAGQDSIDHMEEIVYTHEPFRKLVGVYIDLQFGRARFADHPELSAAVPDFAAQLAPEIAALADTVKAHGLAVTPTLITFGTIAKLASDQFRAVVRPDQLRYVHPLHRQEWGPETNRFRTGRWREQADLMASYLHRNHELQQAIVKALHDRHVPIFTGTDAPFDYVVQGFALHDELALLVQCGLRPYEALRCATSDPWQALGDATCGTIAPGKRADLVLLAANPLVDIANTQRITGVVMHGEWHPRAELDARLGTIAEHHRAVEAAMAPVLAALERGEAKAAIDAWQDSGVEDDPTLAGHVEDQVNTFAYRALNANKIDSALDLFLLNTETFPDSAACWSSLGEAYETKNDWQLARDYYQRALQIDPYDVGTRERLANLQRK